MLKKLRSKSGSMSASGALVLGLLVAPSVGLVAAEVVATAVTSEDDQLTAASEQEPDTSTWLLSPRPLSSGTRIH